jgi:hypothetical protein
MGSSQHKEKKLAELNKRTQHGPPKFCPIKDQFETIDQVTDALREAGLESSNLIIGTTSEIVGCLE